MRCVLLLQCDWLDFKHNDSQELIRHISDTLPELPDTSIKQLVDDFDLTMKDAKTLVALEDGERLSYFDKVLRMLVKFLQEPGFRGNPRECLTDNSISKADGAKYAKLVANWSVT